MWLLNFHCCRCSSWRLWYLSFRFDDGSGYMGNRTEDAKKDDKGDIYFRILLRLVAFYLKKNLFTGIRNNLGIGQCCKTPLPPKPDRQLLHSQPLEQLLFLSSWFHLRKSHCSQTTRTNLRLRNQLNKQEIFPPKEKITWALVSVARFFFLQSWTDVTSVLCLLNNSSSSRLGSSSAGCAALGPG